MILFAKDWAKYPTASLHLDTTNRSWLEMASLYRYMGVTNHAWPLALINPRLKDVDPFDENLSMEDRTAVAVECKINPWYYFREIARIPAGSGEDAVPMRANRGNLALYWCFMNHVMTFLIQIRQTGKSVSVDALVTWLLNIRCRATDINMLTKDDSLRSKQVQRLKDMDSELPYYLKQRTKLDANNTEMITVKSLSNAFRVFVPQGSPKAADKVGRGFTSPIFLDDEGPFQSNADISIPAALMAGNDARDRAARNNEPYGTIFTTTAGKKDTREGKYFYNLLSSAASWKEAYLDAKDEQDLERMIRSASRALSVANKIKTANHAGYYRVSIIFNHNQLGYDDDWLARKIEEMAGDDEQQIDRDLFNRWTSGSMSSPLPIETMERIRQSETEPEYVEISPEGYTTNWYIPKEQIATRLSSGIYVMSMDTSDASGGDDIAMRLIDPRSAELIAQGKYNDTNIITFSQWVTRWFTQYSTIRGIIERRSTGSTVLDQLLLTLPANGIDPYAVLFNRVVNDAEENPDRFKEVQVPMGRRASDIYVKYKKHFGYATSSSGITSRSELYSKTLQAAAHQAGHLVKDSDTINQVLALQIRNGRVDHPPGEHDDFCIAWLLGYWWITQGKNLSFYGFDTTSILLEHRKAINSSKGSNWNEQQSMQATVSTLLKQLENEPNEYLQQKLESQIRAIASRLDHSAQAALTVEDLIAQVKQTKQERKAARVTQQWNSSAVQDYSGWAYRRW
jgi:hypothetical protein